MFWTPSTVQNARKNLPPFKFLCVQAIGRCAASIPEVTATCLSGLVHLMSSSDQVIDQIISG